MAYLISLEQKGLYLKVTFDMKICFFAASNSIHSYRWVKYFAGRGHTITWVSLCETIFEPIEGVKYYEIVSSKNLTSIFRSVVFLRRILKSNKPDCLHVHYLGVYGLIALISGFRSIVSTPWGSDIIINKKNFLYRILIRTFLKRANLITCDAQHMKDQILELGVSKNRIEIINFGIDTEQFSPKPANFYLRKKMKIKDGFTIISMRNFEPVYDLKTLVLAMPDILSKHPDVNFVLIGKGSQEKELKDLVKELKIESSVYFPGFISNPDLPQLLNNSDIYISTSLSDAGIAASTAEAMACGVPVVVTDTGENYKWVKNGETGYSVPPSEPLRLAEAIKNMILEPKEIKKVGLAGRKIISDYNDYQTEMAKMENLYKLVF